MCCCCPIGKNWCVSPCGTIPTAAPAWKWLGNPPSPRTRWFLPACRALSTGWNGSSRNAFTPLLWTRHTTPQRLPTGKYWTTSRPTRSSGSRRHRTVPTRHGSATCSTRSCSGGISGGAFRRAISVTSSAAASTSATTCGRYTPATGTMHRENWTRQWQERKMRWRRRTGSMPRVQR